MVLNVLIKLIGSLDVIQGRKERVGYFLGTLVSFQVYASQTY